MRLKLYRGKWCAVFRENGTTKRTSLRTTDRAEAERRLKDLERAPAGDTVADIMASYLAEKKHSARSYQGMESAWRSAKATFGNLRPDQIDRPLSRSYIMQRRKAGVSDGTIIKEMSVVRAGVKWANRGTDAVFALPSAPPPRERYLTKAEVNRLIDACDLPHVKLFVLLAWSTAARASAILELTWDRVDFDRGQIRLAGGKSGGKGRATVPMTERLRAALSEAALGRETEWVVEWGGKRVKSLKRAFATASRVAKLDDVSPHVIRHSAAVAMAEDGVSMAEIAQVLGHTNESVTFKVYARFSPAFLKRAVKALE
jgi:integrase